MKKVLSIYFRANLQGEGIVNYDSNDQKKIFNEYNVNHMKTTYENHMFAKKSFYLDEDGNLQWKIKISDDCLRKNLFPNIQAQTPNIVHSPEILIPYLASPEIILKGVLFADKNENIKRKSAFKIEPAIQTNNAVSNMETFSRSGEKISRDENNSTKDNSFFNKEMIGHIEYETKGCIKLDELQFVSMSPVLDRRFFNPDYFEKFKKYLNLRLKNFNSELKYYKKKNVIHDIPELGFVFSNENMNDLIKFLFTKIYDLKIWTKGAHAEVVKLEYKVVYDSIENKIYDDEDWITISNIKDIDNMNFDIEQFYEEVIDGEEKEKGYLNNASEKREEKENQKREEKEAKRLVREAKKLAKLKEQENA